MSLKTCRETNVRNALDMKDLRCFSVEVYIKTTKRRNKDGSVVEYYHLAHNERDPETKAPVPHIIHNFGRADRLDRDELVRLCRSLARVCGLEVNDPLEEGRESRQEEKGLPEGLTLIGTVELGTPFLVESLWERLGIGPALRAAGEADGCRVPYERALLAMTANRLCEPQSKLGVWDRWLSKVFLPTCEGLELPQMYEAMDLLHRHAEEVEKSVFHKVADLFNLEVDIVFYDTTTASFSIDDADEDGEGVRKLGHSKEGTWTAQVVVALAVTREGLPVRSWVFPGNTSDVTTIEKIKKDLRGWKLGRALFVADAGMNSEDTRKELAKACGKYLMAARMGSVKEIKEEVLSKRGRYKVISDNLHAKEVVVGDGVRRRRYILCYNPRQAERERLHREQVLTELKEKLAEHPDKRATAQWAIELKASGRYGRYLTITKGGKLRMNSTAVKEAERRDGKWVIQTNDDTITLEDAAEGYKALLVIERCFRSLKRTQIKMMPMYHWLPRRIEIHVKICVLALLIERVAERACQKSWARIRDDLVTLQATKFSNKNFVFFERNQPSKEAAKVLQSLDIPMPKRVLAIAPQ